ncbi:MAG: 2-dehydropantoate 2-reductase [Nitratireductor sp.]|nr:2-dehydropantoate 2-reductase [Nitratireductor sp.]
MRIAVYGAGSIGCLVGGSLLAQGNDVVMIGRDAVRREVMKHGLTVSDLDGRSEHIPPEKAPFFTDPGRVLGADVILLTVKSPDTRQAAKEIAAHANKDVVVYSLQNGVGNAPILREELKGFAVVAGMVAFNALSMGEGRFHRATDAGLVVGKHPASHQLARLLKQSHIPTTIATDMQAVLWGKLCLNLNNAINVLSDLPLKQELERRNYRRVLAACIEEALAVMRAKNIEPATIGKVSPRYLPHILNLPDPVFKLVAGSMMKMDENARSSMWEDLQMGREPEIDYLNGKIAAEGDALKIATPANARITELVKAAFASGASPKMSGQALLDAITPKA